MKYKSCFLLETGIMFKPTDLRPCCNDLGDYFSDLCKPEEFDKYLAERKKYIDMFREGKIPEPCKGCSLIEEKDWLPEYKIGFICIAHRSNCSCNCTYCYTSKDKNFYNNQKTYDVMPFLNKLIKEDYIKNPIIDIAGGECTEYPKEELNGLLDFADKYGSRLDIFSSGIIYSEKIAELLGKSKLNIVVSIDSGRKETYEKIKRVKAFDKVWQNMEKYLTASNPNEQTDLGFVTLKYIIIPNCNDNIEELDAFFNKAKQIGTKRIQIALEYFWFDENKDKPFPKHFFNLLDFIEEQRKDFRIEYEGKAIYLWTKRIKEDENFHTDDYFYKKILPNLQQKGDLEDKM